MEIFLTSSAVKGNGFLQQPDGMYIAESITDSVDRIRPYSTTIMMTTPLSTIKSMQWALFSRMLLILSMGGILAFLLSMLITRKLVTPLTDLRKQLKKVETRRFSEVELVKSSGEVGEVAQSVYQLANELEKYHRAQKQFFQNASHELKTPLMSIQGYAEGIRDGIFTGEHADKGLETIADECERLKKIVTEMILLAKLESEEGIFEDFDIPVQNLIAKTVERMNPLLLDKGIQIQVSSIPDWGQQPHIKVDPEKLLQALLNIVGNASRYAKETIHIHVSENDNRVAIEISDDGDGISEAILPRLFQRFVKGQDGQTGLGLAISRAIVERCHGQISAHNRMNGGAAFVLSFPVSQAS
ncbi:sensor histidine kinase [Paenibacillus sp. NPDC058174]|uniref:sensor histidine kinase n=1 Tax=Paenibacillus sp. NPDC058174 TaxID=3346366 RepID=UPI0036D9CDEC